MKKRWSFAARIEVIGENITSEDAGLSVFEMEGYYNEKGPHRIHIDSGGALDRSRKPLTTREVKKA